MPPSAAPGPCAQPLQRQHSQPRSFGLCGASTKQPDGGLQVGCGAPSPMQQTPHLPFRGPPPEQMPFRLICVLARGCDNLDSWPMEQKMIGLPGDVKTILGRQYQSGFFESLLNAQQHYLTCVSRVHVELSPLPPRAGERLGNFEVTNLSNNPIVVDNQRLQ